MLCPALFWERADFCETMDTVISFYQSIDNFQDLFLERGGIPILLSLLEKCPPSMQNLVLGALLDLTEDPRAVSHVVTWRGVGQITAVSLLVSLWRQEEAAMGVKRDLNNVMIGRTIKNISLLPIHNYCTTLLPLR